MSLDSFKEFVRKKPNLIEYVNNKENTWQDFYNMYSLYGENNSIWDKYDNKVITKPTTLKDFFNTFKDIDITKLEESFTSLQKGIDYIGNIVKEKEVKMPTTNYERRPMYKYFDD